MTALDDFARLSGKLFLDGALVSSRSTSTFDVIEPATEDRIGVIADATDGEVDQAIDLARADLRLRPKGAVIEEAEIEQALARRKAARAEKDFATSDAIRDELAGKGVEVMDGDPLGWEWTL